MSVDVCYPQKKTFPEFTDLITENVFFVNNPMGKITGFQDQKVVIYSKQCEDLSVADATNILESVNDRFTIFLTVQKNLEVLEEKFNCKVFYLPQASSWYTTQIQFEKVNFDKHFDKHFLSLNNRGSWPRLGFAQFINNFNLQDKFYFSYRHEDRDNLTAPVLYELLLSQIGETWFNEKVNDDHLFNQLPIVGGLQESFNQELWSAGNIEYYNNTFASIVLDTYIHLNYNPLLTEKAWKPIAYGQPLFLFNSAGSLEKYRELGFETFSCIFDESYDNIDNSQLRFETILQQINTLCNLSLDDLMDLYTTVRPVLEHNYNFFWYEWRSKYIKSISDIQTEIRELVFKHST